MNYLLVLIPLVVTIIWVVALCKAGKDEPLYKSNRLVIDRSRWRTGNESDVQTGVGETCLLNEEGYMCCLGFYSEQHGVSQDKLLDRTDPWQLGEHVEKIPLLVETDKSTMSVLYNSPFAKEAMLINDNAYTKVEDKERRITELFATKGIEVVFTGKYE